MSNGYWVIGEKTYAPKVMAQVYAPYFARLPEDWRGRFYDEPTKKPRPVEQPGRGGED